PLVVPVDLDDDPAAPLLDVRAPDVGDQPELGRQLVQDRFGGPVPREREMQPSRTHDRDSGTTGGGAGTGIRGGPGWLRGLGVREGAPDVRSSRWGARFTGPGRSEAALRRGPLRRAWDRRTQKAMSAPPCMEIRA